MTMGKYLILMFTDRTFLYYPWYSELHGFVHLASQPDTLGGHLGMVGMVHVPVDMRLMFYIGVGNLDILEEKYFRGIEAA